MVNDKKIMDLSYNGKICRQIVLVTLFTLNSDLIN